MSATPRELAAKLKKEAESVNGFVKYSTAINSSNAIERLLAWIAEEGERTNTCTRNVTSEVCSYCQCGKQTKGKHE